MPKHRNKVVIAFVLLLVVIFSVTLFRNLTEGSRRSLNLKEVATAGNQIGINIQVVSINSSSLEMTAQIRVRLIGKLAKDPFTPTADLKLFINGIRGPQVIEFPRGQTISPFTAVFSLDGNANHYPFDRYTSSIRIMATGKAAASRSRSVSVHARKRTGLPDNPVDDFLVAAPQEGESLPISSSMIASIPGIKFEGQRIENVEQGIEGFDLGIRHADNVIVVAVLAMALMMSLAVSVLLMSIKALMVDDKTELLPLSLCVSLLFGLPALRNAQPAVPPLGVLGDYLSFLWAEMVVAVSAVMVIWTWLIRQRKASVIADDQ